MGRTPTTARYRFVSPWAYLTAPVACLAALRVSIALALVVLAAMLLLFGVLLRIGSDVSEAGVTVRRISSHMFIPWSDVAAIGTVSDWNFGDRIELTLADGRRAVLPAPTSKTGRFPRAYEDISARAALL